MVNMLKDNQQLIEEYFEEHGIPVQTSFIRGGLSIYASNRKTPIARFVPCGSRGGVEVMWYIPIPYQGPIFVGSSSAAQRTVMYASQPQSSPP